MSALPPMLRKKKAPVSEENQAMDAKLLDYLGKLPAIATNPSLRTLGVMLCSLGEIRRADSLSKEEAKRYDAYGRRLQTLRHRGLVRQESRRWWFLVKKG